ncbi:MAG: hypothetical protein RLZZ28_2210 [Bacteroidota bacterium]|jgi:hypothetical protein
MKYLPALVSLFFLVACKNNHPHPNVSNIPVRLTVERFEQDFFKLDTLNLDASLNKLNRQYPGFTQDFIFNILGTTADSAKKDIPGFIRSYQQMQGDAKEVFKDFVSVESEIKNGLQYLHYYFPQYRLPEKLVTFIGPINSYGNIITPNSLAIGLQMYMGASYPMYLSEQGQQMYPRYISRKFEKAFIPVNCIKNIIDDMYPGNNLGRPLVEQMIEAGKRQYLLDLLLPETADSLKTGYTGEQLKGCYESEKSIWSFFIQNDLLYSTDPNNARDYMNEAPNTPALGEASPGNIGQFVGAQIVKKWMEKNPKTGPDLLMKTPAKQIFEEAKYKPK